MSLGFLGFASFFLCQLGVQDSRDGRETWGLWMRGWGNENVVKLGLRASRGLSSLNPEPSTTP